MSRIGMKPIPVPKGVTVDIGPNNRISVRGPKGELQRTLHADMIVKTGEAPPQDREPEGSPAYEGTVIVERPSDSKFHRSLHGLTRTLCANMVEGVTQGYEKRLEIQGVGYRAEAKGQEVTFSLGFSHPVVYQAPPGIEITVEGTTIVVVRGIDKEAVGQTAAEIRALRKVEPYKGKGIRYVGEYVRRKAGKAGKVGAGGAAGPGGH